ncbi:glycosyltransferase [Stella sp.]|uniref:glycosyltransferase n=1 Tax=Stella sp. TaxID=2912054 RepID=UPI0035B08926
MHNILFVTVGTLGDLDPYLAIAAELVRRGHGATIATLARHRATVERAGIAFAEAQADWEPGSPSDPMVRMMTHPDEAPRVIMREFVLDRLPDAIRRVRPLIARHDAVVQHATAFAGRISAELEGRPWLGGTVTPGLLPSRIRPPIHVWPRSLRSAPPQRKLAYFQELVAPMHAVRAGLGLPAIPAVTAHLSPFGTLALFSRHFAADPGDWPATVHLTGFCRYVAPVGADDWSRVEAFLAAGPPPVVVTLGTHSPAAGRSLFQGMAAALARLGVRGLVVGNSAEALGLEDGPLLACFPSLPFARVFPRAAAVVCHGGIGSTVRGLEAGVPVLVLPFPVHDHYDTASHAQRLGAAEVLPLERFDGMAAEAALRKLLGDPSYRQAAARFAAAIAEEGDGAARAADRILAFADAGRLA